MRCVVNEGLGAGAAQPIPRASSPEQNETGALIQMAFYKRLGIFAAPMVLMAAGAAATTGCDGDDPIGDLAEQCGLSCPAEGEGIISGNAAISGITSVDAFFSSVVTFDNVAAQVTGNMQLELDGIALSLGLEKGSSGADIKAALQAKIEANVDGELSIDFQPARCQVDAKVTAEATAKCDVEVEPGEVSAKCEGKCEAEVDVEGNVSCDAEATVTCSGKAPNFECSGTCEGSCELDADVECSGTCKGKCTGNCTYEPGEAKCEAGATASCEASASADAKIECDGKCEGKVEPPKASAECEASAKADAEVSASCTPPSLQVSYKLKADIEGDADAKAEFDVWLEGFKGRISALAAATAKADIL